MRTTPWRRWSIYLPLLAVAALAAGGLELIGETPQPSGQAQPKEAGLPADLQHISAHAGGFLCIRVADLWDSPMVRTSREQMKDLKEVNARIKEGLGVTLEEIDRLDLVFLDSLVEPGQEPLVLLATRQPYDHRRVLAPLGNTREVRVAERYQIHVGDRGQAVHWIDDRTFAIGRASTVERFVQAEVKREGPLAAALRHAAGKHALVAGINGNKLDKLLERGLPPDVRPLEFLMRPLFQAQAGLLIADVGEQVQVSMEAAYSREGEARAALKAAGGLEMILLGAIRQGIQQTPRQERLAGLAPQLKLVCTALEQAPIEQKGNTVRTTARVPLDPKLSLALVQAPARMRQAALRSQSMNNLKQIALGTINYADSNQSTMPPPAIYGKDGKPLLSWRVLILPYVEQQNLYNQFHLDEPWDSEHNKKLLAILPKVYASPADPEGTRKHETHYLALVGRSAAFEGKKGMRFPASYTDGTSNTIMVVEASKSVPWTKPEDIPFDPDKDPPEIGGLFPDGFLAALCDGSARLISRKVSKTTLKSAITRDGGEVLGPDW